MALDNKSSMIRREKINEILAPLFIDDNTIRKVRDTFESEMELGLAKNPAKKSSLQMENTFIPELCNGKEEGEYLALDLGGTNFRVILLILKPGCKPFEAVKYYTVPEHLRLGNGKDLFDFLAACIHDFLTARNLLDKKLSLGFCFSFPMVQKSLNVGILVTWTKSFNCPDVVGKDAVELLNDAIKRRGDLSVDVCAVVNDTTGTLMRGAYMDPKCAIGLILGTGCNACYLEKVKRIEKWIGEHSSITEVVVDIEWGAFGDNGVLDFIKTEFDRLVDNNSLLVNSFTFEKMFAGKFLGEQVRQVILKMIEYSILFDGHSSSQLRLHNSLTAADVSDIISDDNDEQLRLVKEILSRLGINDASVEDCSVVQEICWVLSARGALLVSICLASLLDRMEKADVTVAVDGSLYKSHPFLHDLMTGYISELAPKRKFHLILAEDGSGKGAGLVASVVNRLDISELHE